MERARLAGRPLTEPHPSRLDAHDPDRHAILAAHRAALEAAADGYADPRTGSFVFTAAYLAQQESCCEAGCRHCPYLT